MNDYDDFEDYGYYEPSELKSHARKDKIKWIITAVAFALVFVLIGGLCFALFRTNKEESLTGDYAFDIDLNAVTELTEKDLKDSVPISLAAFIGSDTSDTDDEEEPFAYIHMISYDEETDELILFASGNPFSSGITLNMGILVRAQHFKQEDVAKITKSNSILMDYFFGDYEYDAYLYVADEVDGKLQGGWLNMAVLWLSGLIDDDFEEMSEWFISAPTASNLKFEAEGTIKPSDKIMNILVKEVKEDVR